MKLQSLLRRSLGALARDEGQGMVEYALILVLIAVGVIVVLIILGNQVQNVFCNISGGLVMERGRGSGLSREPRHRPAPHGRPRRSPPVAPAGSAPRPRDRPRGPGRAIGFRRRAPTRPAGHACPLARREARDTRGAADRSPGCARWR